MVAVYLALKESNKWYPDMSQSGHSFNVSLWGFMLVCGLHSENRPLKKVIVS